MTLRHKYSYITMESLQFHRLSLVACMYGTCGWGARGPGFEIGAMHHNLCSFLSSFIHPSLPSQRQTKSGLGLRYIFGKTVGSGMVTLIYKKKKKYLQTAIIFFVIDDLLWQTSHLVIVKGKVLFFYDKNCLQS